MEGNPEFTCKIFGAEDIFDGDYISRPDANGKYPVFTTLSVKGYLYNEDVTAHIKERHVTWTRDSGNVAEDNTWAAIHANSGFSVPLTWEDLGKNASERFSCKFKVTVIIIDETTETNATDTNRTKQASDELTFN